MSFEFLANARAGASARGRGDASTADARGAAERMLEGRDTEGVTLVSATDGNHGWPSRANGFGLAVPDRQRE